MAVSPITEAGGSRSARSSRLQGFTCVGGGSEEQYTIRIWSTGWRAVDHRAEPGGPDRCQVLVRGLNDDEAMGRDVGVRTETGIAVRDPYNAEPDPAEINGDQTTACRGNAVALTEGGVGKRERTEERMFAVPATTPVRRSLPATLAAAACAVGAISVIDAIRPNSGRTTAEARFASMNPRSLTPRSDFLDISEWEESSRGTSVTPRHPAARLSKDQAGNVDAVNRHQPSPSRIPH